MSEILLVWLEFAACGAVIGIAGSRLSRYGDILADKLGLPGSWVGLILLATVTSLPELVTGISSVTVNSVPNIAIGDALGSCVLNLVMLVVLDFLRREESVFRQASQGHILSAGFGTVLIGYTGFSILLGDRAGALQIGYIGGYVPVIVVLYLVAMRTVFSYERARVKSQLEQAVSRYPEVSLRGAVLRYALAGLLVVGAGAWLPAVAAHLSTLMGWRTSFVGTLFVAGATSLPELVVTVSALRLGALDMAFANLLGSNLFDILIVAIDDLFYTHGPILAKVSPVHAMTAMSAVVMNGIVIVGLLYRPKGRALRSIGWVGLGLLTVYLLNSYVLYLHGD